MTTHPPSVDSDVPSVLAVHGDNVDRSRLANSLVKSGSPARLIGTVKSRKSLLGVDQVKAARQEIEALYDRGLRTNRLGA